MVVARREEEGSGAIKYSSVELGPIYLLYPVLQCSSVTAMSRRSGVFGSGTDDGPWQQKSTKGGAGPSPGGRGLGACLRLPRLLALYIVIR